MAQAQLVCTGVLKSSASLPSLGDSPLQPWPGGCLGRQDAPAHQCSSSSSLSSHHTAKHPNKPMQLSSAQEHPGLQKLPGVDAGRVANAVPKLPRLCACTEPQHVLPHGAQPLPQHVPHSLGAATSDIVGAHHPREPGHQTVWGQVVLLLLYQDVAWLCHASLAPPGLGKQQRLVPSHPLAGMTACCHPAWVLSL